MSVLSPNFIIYNGVDSRDLDIFIELLPPVTRAARRYTKQVIPGVDGDLLDTDDTFENYSKSIELTLTNRERIDEILNHYSDSGNLILSNEIDKRYRVNVLDSIPITWRSRKFDTVSVNFDCHPFKFEAEPEAITLTTPASLNGQGTRHALPMFEIYGSGNITVNVQGQSFAITGLSGSVTVNSEIMECYSGQTSKNNSFSGVFPVINPGLCPVSWAGNVTKVIIKPNWRWR